jgi:protease I
MRAPTRGGRIVPDTPEPRPRQVRPLSGKRVAVLVEHKFIPQEIEAYRTGFAALGAQVEIVSRIWWGAHRPASATFYSDVDPLDADPFARPQALDARTDISTVAPADFAVIVMAANYTSVRLRWAELPQDAATVDPRQLVQAAPAVRFFAEAMRDPAIVKGALCHGLWLLTPFPELMRGRRVTCHTVVMADVLNAGADVVLDRDEQGRHRVAPVVTDRDLVTGYSMKEAPALVDAIAALLADRQPVHTRPA